MPDSREKPPALSIDVEALNRIRHGPTSPISGDARNVADHEAPPQIDFYSKTIQKRDPSRRRPTIHELTEGTLNVKRKMSSSTNSPSEMDPDPQSGAKKFGWIEGVFVRCLQNIIGVILFLRLSWVTAQAGVLLAIVIVTLATVVTTITAISTSAIATNGTVKGGGLYYLISRILGPEFGGSIGLIFSLANCVGGALYIVGFSETVRDQLLNFGFTIIDGGANDVRVIGVVTCTILMTIIIISVSFESKLQQGMMMILIASLLSYYIGTFFTTPTKEMIGFTGYSFETLASNLLPSFRDGHSFFTIFAVYFPAATGIMAGANISGDLKSPQKAIPRGTLLSIFVSGIIYLSVIVLTAFTVVRDSDGEGPPSPDILPECAWNSTCQYGMANYYQVVASISIWPPIMVFGIFSSTLSSALASLVSAPKVFQAVCKDELIPLIGYFKKGYGPSNEPRRAYLLSFILVMGMVLIGELNIIAPVISNFFLCSYALVNYSCFNASFSQTPGFRPAFAYYNMWVSLLGSVLCVIIMFIMSWTTALITFFFFSIIFMFIKKIKPDVNWGASIDANTYKNTLHGIMKLSKNEEHVKNYRPQVLVMCGEPWERASLVLMGGSITRATSLLVCGNVILENEGNLASQLKTARETDVASHYMLRKIGVKAICKTLVASSLELGCNMLCQTSGLGKLMPNIILFGFIENDVNDDNKRHTINTKTRSGYLQMIMSAFNAEMGVAIYRSRQTIVLDKSVEKRGSIFQNGRISDASKLPRPLCKGCIDVWWLSDDGGLTLLIPYLLTLPKSHLEGSRLRVFTVSSSENIIEESAKMVELLKLFRIPYHDIHVIPMKAKPKQETIDTFNEFIAPYKGDEEGCISDKELETMKSHTYRQLVCHEMLIEQSKDADLVVVTLPFPPSGISGALFTSWLEMMTISMPSTLFVRGNQQSVLTFYS